MVDRLANTPANAQRIANVENCFAAGEPLAVPGRVLVGEGVLTKICRKKPKPRQFFLFNDILVYGNIILSKKKYIKQRIIPLEQIKIESLPDEADLKNGWLIKTPTKSFAVYAATATEKAEWIAHIKKCLNDLIIKTGKQPSEEHAAVWVPDNDANICMHCKLTEFTLLNRKHHCRKCGDVVCGGCSNKKFLIPSMSSKPLRVCDSCYDSLGSKTTQAPMASRPAPQPPVEENLIDVKDSSADDSDDENMGKTEAELLENDEKTMFYNDDTVAVSELVKIDATQTCD
ncbi:PLEKHF2 [Cordylochernes scorpioides]|uniref:PLEKHF2 n=1 Tax=Cordylochernes scorpioides TaxID=51811 RepID=A0ABY6LU77_9ARAC|nr:PLEKHF2 [Cordylochernes scorpioides]